jgi:hypothetical protein
VRKYIITLATVWFISPLTCMGAEECRELPVSTYIDKMKAGWIGQMAGVGWGDPTEFEWVGERIPIDKMPRWQDEMVNQFKQDDIYVEMTFLRTLEVHGIDVDSRQAGLDFANSRYGLAHANRAGRWNLRVGIAPPDSGHPQFNRHADDIDYQIEADFSGLICPGLPNEVIRLGEVFGRLMNYGDSLYGGQFVGGMVAEAFFENDVEKIIQAGLDCVPRGSQFHECISDVMRWYHQRPDNWDKTWELINAKYNFNPEYRKASCAKFRFNIDAKINAAYMVMGLLYGAGDIDRTIVISTRCGQDSDCNPSNAAGVLFTTMGYSNIPERFKSALDPKGKFSHTPYNFDSLTAVCEKLARQAVIKSGGRIKKEASGKDIFVIPQIETKPSKLEQSWNPDPIANSRYTPEELATLKLKVQMKESKKGLDDVTYNDLKPGEFMRQWLILGPMPYPCLEDIYVYTMDEGVDMSDEKERSIFGQDTIDVVDFQPKTTICDREYQWSVLETERSTIDLTQLIKEDGEYKVAYLWAQIEMPQNRVSTLGIGSDDGVKVWLNGELVHANWVLREVVEDNDRIPVHFKKGKNQLVLKIQSTGGPFGFCCRLMDD